MSEPYREAAALYFPCELGSPIPLPLRSKEPPPDGFTGRSGLYASYADVQAWMDGSEGSGNIAIRLADNVIGIDVDNYSQKVGAATLAARIADWGPLPATWRSSAREAPSGIYWYRVPPALAWRGTAGPDIDIIRKTHRYAVVWPSVHPDGMTYQWYSPAGVAMPFVVPRAEELPELPAAWVHGLSTGVYTEEHKDHAPDIEAWLHEFNRAGTCRMLRHAEIEIAAQFRHGSRHEVLVPGVLRIIRLAEQGHRGLLAALDAVLAQFRRAASEPGRGAERTEAQLVHEWDRAVDGAVAIVRGQPTRSTPAEPCICDVPLSGLIPPAELDDGRRRAPAGYEQPGEQLDQPAGQPGPAAGAEPVIADAGYFDLVMMRQRTQRAVRLALDAEEHAARFRVPPFESSLAENLLKPIPEIRFTIPELMPHGTNVLLSAQFKAGKTITLNNVVKAIADHEPFLGKYTPQYLSGRIAIFNYEVEETMYVRWLREAEIMNSEKITLLTLRGYSLPITAPRITDWVVDWLKRHEIEFWVIDPFARAFVGCGDNENDNMQVAKFLDTVDIIKERAGVSGLIMATHTGRAEMAEGAERARGATRLDDWADVRWMLTTDAAEHRYLRASGRDVNMPETVLAYDRETRKLTLGSGNRAVTRSAGVQDAVTAIVRTQPGVTLNALRTAVRELNGKTGSDAITEAIGALKRSGKLRVVVDGMRTQHYLTSPDEL